MLLTAHSGANGTPANKKGYFDAMRTVNADVIEVDIRRKKDFYYLSHDRCLFAQKLRLPLSYAFDYIKEYDFKINCDLKEEGYVPYLMDLAEQMGVQDRIIITGSACTKPDLAAVRFGDIYVNDEYLPKPLPENVGEIKRVLKEMGPFAKGINLSYKVLTDSFMEACAREDVAVSVFTVNDEALIKKFAAFPAVVNITTVSIDKALRILGRETRK